MSDSAFSPPSDASRELQIAYFRSLLATPPQEPRSIERRRAGRDGLAMLGVFVAEEPKLRRRRWLLASHLRAACKPRGPVKRI